jgi:membrane-associated phospholipid phosphatase
LPSKQNLVTAGVGVAASLVAHTADSELNQWIADQDSASYPSVGGTFGDGLAQAGIAIGVFAVGVAAEHEKTLRVGNHLIRGQVLNAVLTGTVKLATQRTRPSGGDHSMPSGHTSAAVTTAIVLHQHFGWKVGIPAYAAAGFVGWSRLRGEHHWLSDVTMGATIGAVAGLTVTTDERRRWTLVPAVAPDRAALYVLWTP